jgi:plastocyanin
MVTFVASIIGAAAIFARVASAVPQGYGMASSSAMSPSYTSGSSKMDNSKMDNSKMDNSYGSGSDNKYGSSSSSAYMPSYTSSMSSYGSGSSKYGSGSSSWSSGGYDSCVQQCVAQYGSPSSMNMPPSSTYSSGSSGSGATHTVVVAPTKGVFRYVPFAVNASVGDTVKFIWGADEHTVTKSSELALCNKTSDAPFASGEQNQSFVFTQMVNDTNPTFYYCGTPTHCEKGMFGIINPPSVFNNAGSASMMMPSLASQYPSTQAAMSYAANMTANQSSAAMWGSNIDMSSVPSWAQSYAAENILYTQSFLAMNPESLSADGSVDLSPLSSNAIMLPTDVAAAARTNNDDATTSSSSAGYPAASSTASGSKPSSTAAGDSSKSSTSGAGALSSPRVAVALVAVVAAFFAL